MGRPKPLEKSLKPFPKIVSRDMGEAIKAIHKDIKRSQEKLERRIRK